jgi:uncharacterized protein YeaO (DUF488 family)
MKHPIYRVTGFEHVAPYTLQVKFNDKTSQVIDFETILAGQIYGPLRDRDLFERVALDPDVHTLVWPNGADFDPTTLHDWFKHLAGLKALARKWVKAESEDEWVAVQRVKETLEEYGPFEPLASLSKRENVPLPTLAQAAREKRLPAVNVTMGWLARPSAVRKRIGLSQGRGRPPRKQAASTASKRKGRTQHSVRTKP